MRERVLRVACTVALAAVGVSSCASSAGGSGTPAEDGAWDPYSWKPSEVITPPTYTEEEKLALRDESLESLASWLKIPDPPGIDLVRWTNTVENSVALENCLQEAGYDWVYDPADGSVGGTAITDAQQIAFNATWYECEARYTLDPTYKGNWSDAQIGLMYDYWDEFFMPCLEAHGRTVTRSDQPTRERFIAEFTDVFWGSDTAWYPPWDMPTEREPELRASLARDCPPMPPDSTLYGK